jgi:methylaspartate ammonia-lyase
MNKNVIYEALKAQFEAQRQKSLATLTIYLTNPVGIGEHPQHIEEMETIARSLAQAEDVLETLKRTFESAETTENE